MSIAVIQMTSGSQVTQNLKIAHGWIQQAVDQGAKMIVLPENFALMGASPKDKVNNREPFGSGIIQDFLANTSQKYDIWLVGGTIPLSVSNEAEKVTASCLVLNNQGQTMARYDKIHLFDVLIRNAEQHQESETIVPGQAVAAVDTPFGKLGLAICYDIRFPKLFDVLQTAGVEIIALPAAFTVPTGKAHWEILVRARAIENQIYMLAAAQCGTHSNHRKTYGHSMMVNPWGDILCMMENEPGFALADLDLNLLHQLRDDFPVLKNKNLNLSKD